MNGELASVMKRIELPVRLVLLSSVINALLSVRLWLCIINRSDA